MKKAFFYVLPKTLPILAGFIFLGFSYGIFATSKGFAPIYPILMALFIFAGSMEFVTISLLLSVFDPLTAFFLSLMVNARHIFYGLAMLEKFKGLDFKKYYAIFGMCDETFSINVSLDPPADIDRSWAYFHVTWLNHVYWVLGATLGALFGQFIPFDLTGIEFVLNALFLILLLEQWNSSPSHSPVYIGLASSTGCLLIFGSEHFMIPAMLTMLALFALDFYRKGREQA